MATYSGIRRTEPRSGGEEREWFQGKLRLRSPKLPEEGKNRLENATCVDSVDEAVRLLKKGYAIRMGRPGIPPSYVFLDKLELIVA
jgi:hypothetical protein